MFKLMPNPEVIEGPIRVCRPSSRDSQDAMASFRLARMSFARETSRVRRPRARLCYEVLCDWDGSRRYHRVPGSGILVDAETPQQIEWMWDWVTWYMQQLDGKYLAGPPPASEDAPQPSAAPQSL